ncbi:MAG: aldo/keto reductase [Verrucomicrobia bacterium]|nr:aldo/keto reductase [Verrucomicrobiota bacterium]
MIHRVYGATGTEMSVIGFGGMRFLDQANVEQCAALVKYAYDKGINYFDTAPGYGKSEELFGVALKEMLKERSRRPFYVSTKTFGGDPASVRRDLETSLKRMGLDHIDFYHMWCVMSQQSFTDRKAHGVLKEFEKLKNEGLIKHICVSTHMTGTDIGAMLADYPFEGVLLGYSAMNFAYRDKGLDAAAGAGRGVVVMNPLGGGIIPREPARFAFVRTRAEESVTEGALRFIINDARITVALVGFSTTAQVDEALRAVDGFRPLSKEQVAGIRASLSAAFNELCTGCRYCSDCPQRIPVPSYMEAYNHMLLGKGPQDILNRLKWHWGIKQEDDYLDRCTECGQCEKHCTQKLPIMKRLAEIRREVAQSIASKPK